MLQFKHVVPVRDYKVINIRKTDSHLIGLIHKQGSIHAKFDLIWLGILDTSKMWKSFDEKHRNLYGDLTRGLVGCWACVAHLSFCFEET